MYWLMHCPAGTPVQNLTGISQKTLLCCEWFPIYDEYFNMDHTI